MAGGEQRWRQQGLKWALLIFTLCQPVAPPAPPQTSPLLIDSSALNSDRQAA